MKISLGFDNGVTGSIGIITPDGSYMYSTPIFKEQSYTKKKQNISRVSTNDLSDILLEHTNLYQPEEVFVLIERCMVNGTRFNASLSAVRALEATLIVVESFGFGYEYIDSKIWTGALLPKGIKGTPELKKASMDIGIRKYPHLKEQIEKHGDADGLLIADYLMYHKRK